MVTFMKTDEANHETLIVYACPIKMEIDLHGARVWTIDLSMLDKSKTRMLCVENDSLNVRSIYNQWIKLKKTVC